MPLTLRCATLWFAVLPLIFGVNVLRASEAPTPEQFKQWITDLDDESFQKRADAEAALRANPTLALEKIRQIKFKNGEWTPEDPSAALCEELWAGAELEKLLKPAGVALDFKKVKSQAAGQQLCQAFGFALDDSGVHAKPDQTLTWSSARATWAEAMEAFYKTYDNYPYLNSSRPGVLGFAGQDAGWSMAHHGNVLFMARCIQKFYFTEKGRRKPEDFWSLQFDAHAPTPFFQMHIVSLKSVEAVALDGTRLKLHGELGQNDCAERPMGTSAFVIDADQIPVLGEQPFNLECKFVLMWPKHLKSARYKFPPKEGEQELTKSIGRTFSLKTKTDEQGVSLISRQEVKSGASPEMRIALGWLEALNAQQRPMEFKNLGSTTSGTDDGAYREENWVFAHRPAEIRYIYADEFIPVECTVTFKGMKVAENSGM